MNMGGDYMRAGLVMDVFGDYVDPDQAPHSPPPVRVYNHHARDAGE